MTKDEALRKALEALDSDNPDIQLRAAIIIRGVLAQPEQKYRRGDRLVCLETDEYCVIHIAGTDRQWVKFPDTHIGFYTNEQVDELFEKLAKETDSAQPEEQRSCDKRTWVGLTDEEIGYYIVHSLGTATKKNLIGLIRLCESKLKEKNT
jgi:hypothetical protein